MRDKNRISLFNKEVIIKFIQHIQNHQDFANLPKEEINLSDEDYSLIITYWGTFPDYRLTNVLIDMGVFNNVPGLWYYIEELDWIEQAGIVDSQTVNYYRHKGENNWDYLDYNKYW